MNTSIAFDIFGEPKIESNSYSDSSCYEDEFIIKSPSTEEEIITPTKNNDGITTIKIVDNDNVKDVNNNSNVNNIASNEIDNDNEDYFNRKRNLNIKKPYNMLRENINNILRAYPLNTDTLQEIEKAYSKFNDMLYTEIINDEPDIHKINIDLYKDNKKLTKLNSHLRTSTACMSSVIKKLKKTNKKLSNEIVELKIQNKNNEYWSTFNYTLIISIAAIALWYVVFHILFE